MSKSLRTTVWCTRNSVFCENLLIPNLLSFFKHPENGFIIEGAYNRTYLYLHLSFITTLDSDKILNHPPEFSSSLTISQFL